MPRIEFTASQEYVDLLERARDLLGLQCTFVDEFGQRCRETRFLELHHELAHALANTE